MPCHHTCPLYPVCLLCPQWSCSCSSLSSLDLGCILSPTSPRLRSFSQTCHIHSEFCAFDHLPTDTFVFQVLFHEIFCLNLFALYRYRFVICFKNEQPRLEKSIAPDNLVTLEWGQLCNPIVGYSVTSVGLIPGQVRIETQNLTTWLNHFSEDCLVFGSKPWFISSYKPEVMSYINGKSKASYISP